MNDISIFLRRNAALFGMIAFVVVFYSALAFFSPSASEKGKPKKPLHMTAQEVQQKEARFRANIQSHPRLVQAAGVIFGIVFAVGLYADAKLLMRLIRRKPLVERRGEQPSVPWGVREIIFLFVLLFFIETLLMAGELVFFRLIGVGAHPHRDLLLMVNSVLRDILTAGILLFLIVKKYGSRLADIGLTANDFFRNVFLGLRAYFAIIPPLVLGLLALSLVAGYFSYEPPPQPVVEIYLRQKAGPMILIFTFFVAALGPVLEEIFFRGFTYKALRSRFGVAAGMICTSIVFAAMHTSLIAFVPIFFLALFLNYLYESTGSLVPGMTAHMTHNLIMVGFTLVFKMFSG